MTSSAHLVTRAALFDELLKVAEALPQDNKAKFKKWVKNTALLAAGTGAGTAVVMGADHLFGKGLGKAWQAASPTTKMLIGAGLGLGSSFAGHKLMQAQRKARDE